MNMTKPKQPGSGTESGYNGWTNYETWNVALWIGNDEGLYQLARESRDYKRFVQRMAGFADLNHGDGINNIATQTPDGVAWNDSDLDIDALDEMIEEL